MKKWEEHTKGSGTIVEREGSSGQWKLVVIVCGEGKERDANVELVLQGHRMLIARAEEQEEEAYEELASYGPPKKERKP